MGDGNIEEIEKKTEMIDYKTTPIYKANVRKTDGWKIGIKVDEDGKLVEIKD